LRPLPTAPGAIPHLHLVSYATAAAAELFTCAGVAAVALFSLVFNIPRWMESKLVREPVDDNATEFEHVLERTDLGDSYAYQLVYFDTSGRFIFIRQKKLFTTFV